MNTKTQQQTDAAVDSSGLVGALRDEIRLLDKKVELLKDLLDEAGKTKRAEYLKLTGREIWQCARRLEKAIAPTADVSHGTRKTRTNG